MLKVNNGEVSSAHHLVTIVPGLETLTDAVLSSLRLFNGRIVGLDSGRSRHTNKPNFIIFQLNMKVIIKQII